mmetsp:Transcript_19486/g.62560  ORF Transcript_19486/g.62560 Transcript_19486/m.62560 type:complete len:260 (-) Transcript_19486:489-1268(-)
MDVDLDGRPRRLRHQGLRPLPHHRRQAGLTLARRPPYGGGFFHENGCLQLRDGDPDVHLGEDGSDQGQVVQPDPAGFQQGRLAAVLHLRHALLQLRPPPPDLGRPRRQDPRRLRRRRRPPRRHRARRRPSHDGLRHGGRRRRLPRTHRRGRNRPQDPRHPLDGPPRVGTLRFPRRPRTPLPRRRRQARRLAQDVQDLRRQARKHPRQQRPTPLRQGRRRRRRRVPLSLAKAHLRGRPALRLLARRRPVNKTSPNFTNNK